MVRPQVVFANEMYRSFVRFEIVRHLFDVFLDFDGVGPFFRYYVANPSMPLGGGKIRRFAGADLCNGAFQR